MVWLRIFILLAVCEALGFTSLEAKHRLRRRMATELNGLFDFRPIHGSGSGNDADFLQEQWEAQQEILRNRNKNHLDKEHLKEKYLKEFQQKEQEANKEITKVLKQESKEKKAASSTPFWRKT